MNAHIAKQSARTLEAVDDREEAAAKILKRSLDRGRLVSKRFRVEGSPIGNSQLVSEGVADDTRAQYGGTVVDLVSRETFLTAQAAHLELPFCVRKSCGAASSKPCTKKSGGVVGPHACRLPAGKKSIAEESATLGPCTHIRHGVACSAEAGKPCQNPNGKPRRPHRNRPEIEVPS